MGRQISHASSGADPPREPVHDTPASEGARRPGHRRNRRFKNPTAWRAEANPDGLSSEPGDASIAQRPRRTCRLAHSDVGTKVSRDRGAPRGASMTTTPRESNAYSIFILRAHGLRPRDHGPAAPTTRRGDGHALLFYDNLICVVFLVDFAVNLATSHPKRELLHHAARLARPPRLDPQPSASSLPHGAAPPRTRSAGCCARSRMLSGQQPASSLIRRPPPQPRASTPLFITVLSALRRPLGLIDPGRPVREPVNRREHHDRRRCAVVGIRDDHDCRATAISIPVTTLGRAVGVFVMFAGVGIIGSLASILASILGPSARA